MGEERPIEIGYLIKETTINKQLRNVPANQSSVADKAMETVSVDHCML